MCVENLAWEDRTLIAESDVNGIVRAQERDPSRLASRSSSSTPDAFDVPMKHIYHSYCYNPREKES